MYQVPRLKTFFCLEVHVGVQIFSAVLAVFWIIYFLGVFFGPGSVGESTVWAWRQETVRLSKN